MSVKVNGHEVHGFWGVILAMITYLFVSFIFIVIGIIFTSPLIFIGWLIWVLAT